MYVEYISKALTKTFLHCILLLVLCPPMIFLLHKTHMKCGVIWKCTFQETAVLMSWKKTQSLEAVGKSSCVSVQEFNINPNTSKTHKLTTCYNLLVRMCSIDSECSKTSLWHNFFFSYYALSMSVHKFSSIRPKVPPVPDHMTLSPPTCTPVSHCR